MRGVCFMFMRTTSKALTPNNISTEVIFQMLDASNGKFIPAFEQMLTQAVLPLCKHLEVWQRVQEPEKSIFLRKI